MASQITKNIMLSTTSSGINNAIRSAFTQYGGELYKGFDRPISYSSVAARHKESSQCAVQNTSHHRDSNEHDHGTVMRSNPAESHINEVVPKTNATELRDRVLGYSEYDMEPEAVERYQSDNSSGNDSTGTNQKCKLSSKLLVEELRNVYSQYRENKNSDTILNEQVDASIPDESREVIIKAKELYIKALKSTPSSQRLSQGDSSVGVGMPSVARSKSEFLGIKTVYGDLLRPFSTSAARGSKGGDKKGGDCLKARKLPCLLSSELSDKKADTPRKGVCEKFCMPCCKPARDPPTCFYPYTKPPCHKGKPPRKAFSECKTIFALKNIPGCECLRPPLGTCKNKKESDKCAK